MIPRRLEQSGESNFVPRRVHPSWGPNMVPVRLAPSGQPHFLPRRVQPSWKPNIVLRNIIHRLVPRKVRATWGTKFCAQISRAILEAKYGSQKVRAIWGAKFCAKRVQSSWESTSWIRPCFQKGYSHLGSQILCPERQNHLGSQLWFPEGYSHLGSQILCPERWNHLGSQIKAICLAKFRGCHKGREIWGTKFPGEWSQIWFPESGKAGSRI